MERIKWAVAACLLASTATAQPWHRLGPWEVNEQTLEIREWAMSETVNVPGMTHVLGVRLTSAHPEMETLPDAVPVFVTDPTTCENINAGGQKVVRNDTGAELPSYVVSASDTLCVLIVEIPGGASDFAVTIGSSATASRPTLVDTGVTLTNLPSDSTYPNGTMPSFDVRKIAASPAGDADEIDRQEFVHPSVAHVRGNAAQWILDLYSDAGGSGDTELIQVNTPFPGNDVEYENPVCYVRNSTVGSWLQVGRNPLLDAPGSPDFNFDCSIALWASDGGATRDRIRVTVRSPSGYSYFDAASLSDLNSPSWSTFTVNDPPSSDNLSPSVWWEQGLGWWMIIVERTDPASGIPGRIALYNSDDGVEWDYVSDVAVGGRNIAWWHGHLRYFPSVSKWYVIVSEQSQDRSQSAFEPKRAVVFESSGSDLSTATWRRLRQPLIDLTSSSPSYMALDGVYCPSFDEDGSGNIAILCSGAENNGGSPRYRTFEFDSTVSTMLGSVSADPATIADVRAFLRLGATSDNMRVTPEDPTDVGLVAAFDFTVDDGTSGSLGDSPTVKVDSTGYTWTEDVGWTKTSDVGSLNLQLVSDSSAYKLSGVPDHLIVTEVTYPSGDSGISPIIVQGDAWAGADYTVYVERHTATSGRIDVRTKMATAGLLLQDESSSPALSTETTYLVAYRADGNFLQLSNQSRKGESRVFVDGTAYSKTGNWSTGDTFVATTQGLRIGGRWDDPSRPDTSPTISRVWIFQPDKAFTDDLWNWEFDAESVYTPLGGKRSRARYRRLR